MQKETLEGYIGIYIRELPVQGEGWEEEYKVSTRHMGKRMV